MKKYSELKKLAGAFVAAFILISAAILLTTRPASAASDTTPFYLSNFDATYDLSRDANKTSMLKVSESMTAQFQQSGNYNHGIERAIPQYYRFGGDASTQSHSFDLQLTAVRGGNYTTYTDGDNKVVRAGDADSMVHGTMSYGFDYQMTNVTRNFDTGDEFYWNVNGTGWSQYFEKVSATVNIAPDLVSQLDGRSKCYVGSNNATASPCQITPSDNADGSKTFTITADGRVPAGQTLTFVIGFKSGTFAAPAFDPQAVFGASWSVIIIAASLFVILTIASIAMLIIVLRKYRPAKTKQAIIPQYAPPTDLTVTEASVWWQKDKGRGQSLFAATLLDLAVNKYLQIYEIDRKILKDTYGIRIVDTIDAQKVSADEIALLSVALGDLSVGADVKLNDLKRNTSLGTQIQSLRNKIQKRLRYERGFYRSKFPPLLIVCMTICYASLFLSSAIVPFLPLAMFLPALIITIAAILWKPISPTGAQMNDYLAGLKMYMTVAEADRIKFLQSVQGAERIDTNDGATVVKLYEKLLPYAVIFGITKDWLNVMQVYYTANDSMVPAWFVGANFAAFNAASFASAVNSFSSTISSSSSGFSGGGAGGGGGGGGGGGW